MSTQTSLAAPRDRLYYLDWLRVMAILTVFFHHVGKFFDYDSFTLYNSVRSLALSVHREFNALWMMPLFFVISGAAVFYSLQSRGAGGFLKERVLRILIPLAVLGTFVINPPQVYLTRLFDGDFSGGFFQWLPSYFSGIYMPGADGNFAPLGLGTHMWYLMYLFVFTLLLLPLFLGFGRSGRSLLARASTRLESPLALLLLFLPVAASSALIQALGLGFLRITGGWDPLSYLFFFLNGYLVFANPGILESIRRQAPAFLAAAVVLTYLYVDSHFGVTLNLPGVTRHDILNNGAIIPLNPWVLTALMALRGLIGWCWILGLLGLAARILNFNNRFLAYAGEAVLPFYILHHTVMYAVGYHVIQWNIGVGWKYAAIALVSLILIMALYEFLIRRVNALRFLFGMKPRQGRERAMLNPRVSGAG